MTAPIQQSPQIQAVLQLKHVQEADRQMWVTEDIKTVTDHVLIARENGGLVSVHRIRGMEAIEFTFDPSAFVAVEVAR